MVRVWRSGDGHDHVLVRVEPGVDVREQLAVVPLSDGEYRLVVPPALAVGLAVGDVFSVDPDTFGPRVVRRSGNLTVWVYPNGAPVAGSGVAEEVEAVGGAFEGAAHGDGILIFTLPVAATFPVIEGIFLRLGDRFPESQWMFGNVYGDDGETPLGWWDEA